MNYSRTSASEAEDFKLRPFDELTDKVNSKLSLTEDLSMATPTTDETEARGGSCTPKTHE